MKPHVLLFSTALLFGTVASAQTTSGPIATTPTDLADENVQALAEKTLESYTQMVELSRIASERAVNPEVKAHADLVVEVLGTAREELQGIMPAVAHAPGMRRENVFDDRGWRAKKAEEFDGDYLKKAADLYEEIEELLSAAAGSEHERLRQHATETRPLVAQNREAVLALAEKLD